MSKATSSTKKSTLDRKDSITLTFNGPIEKAKDLSFLLRSFPVLNDAEGDDIMRTLFSLTHELNGIELNYRYEEEESGFEGTRRRVIPPSDFLYEDQTLSLYSRFLEINSKMAQLLRKDNVKYYQFFKISEFISYMLVSLMMPSYGGLFTTDESDNVNNCFDLIKKDIIKHVQIQGEGVGRIGATYGRYYGKGKGKGKGGKMSFQSFIPSSPEYKPIKRNEAVDVNGNYINLKSKNIKKMKSAGIFEQEYEEDEENGEDDDESNDEERATDDEEEEEDDEDENDDPNVSKTNKKTKKKTRKRVTGNRVSYLKHYLFHVLVKIIMYYQRTSDELDRVKIKENISSLLVTFCDFDKIDVDALLKIDFSSRDNSKFRTHDKNGNQNYYFDINKIKGFFGAIDKENILKQHYIDYNNLVKLVEQCGFLLTSYMFDHQKVPLKTTEKGNKVIDLKSYDFQISPY